MAERREKLGAGANYARRRLRPPGRVARGAISCTIFAEGSVRPGDGPKAGRRLRRGADALCAAIPSLHRADDFDRQGLSDE